MNPDIRISTQPGTPAPSKTADYRKASPEEIRADIERTRAHMDETLDRLGRKVRPRKRLLIGALGLIAAGAAGLIFLSIRASSKRGHKRPHGMQVRKAHLLEEILVMKTLMMAARKGKPAVYVVQPRKV